MITTRKHLTMTNFERNETIIAFFFPFFWFLMFFFSLEWKLSQHSYSMLTLPRNRPRLSSYRHFARATLFFFFLLLGSKRFDLNCMALNLASKRASCFLVFSFALLFCTFSLSFSAALSPWPVFFFSFNLFNVYFPPRRRLPWCLQKEMNDFSVSGSSPTHLYSSGGDTVVLGRRY
jgi:hypothetical protein